MKLLALCGLVVLAGLLGASILQRKILTPNDCRDLDDVARNIAAFDERGEPFHRRFTRSDLELFLKKLEAHEDPPIERAAA